MAQPDNHVYRQIEVTGSSPTGMEDAIRNAVSRTSLTVEHLDWFEVTEVRGHLEGGQVAHWQVSLKIGFRVKDPS